MNSLLDPLSSLHRGQTLRKNLIHHYVPSVRGNLMFLHPINSILQLRVRMVEFSLHYSPPMTPQRSKPSMRHFPALCPLSSVFIYVSHTVTSSLVFLPRPLKQGLQAPRDHLHGVTHPPLCWGTLFALEQGLGVGGDIWRQC